MHSTLHGRTILVAGASGFVGTALVARLKHLGAHVRPLVRPGHPASADGLAWNTGRLLDAADLLGVHGIVNLAGRSIMSSRWNERVKADLRQSRIDSTRHLAESLAQFHEFHPLQNPIVMVSASADGYYGDTGDTIVTEDSLHGHTFLAKLCVDWEAATHAAVEAGSRVVLTRFGMILHPDGGALKKMLPPFRLGLGGPIGDGRQYMSWITRHDLVEILIRALVDDRLRGPLNVTSPNPVTNREFTVALAHALRRPACLPIPPGLLRLVLGEVAEATALQSARVVPARLLALGHPFREPDIATAFASMLGTARPDSEPVSKP